MGRLVSNKGMVVMSKGDTTHEFALESVPVWEAKGWKRAGEPQEHQTNEVTEILTEAAQQAEKPEDDPDAKVYEALSTEPKAVTGPKTKK